MALVVVPVVLCDFRWLWIREFLDESGADARRLVKGFTTLGTAVTRDLNFLPMITARIRSQFGVTYPGKRYLSEKAMKTILLKKQGRSTGRNSGHIIEIYPSNKEFKTSINTKLGDSGGPFFTDSRNGDGVTLLGIQSWGNDKQNGTFQKSGGFAISRVEEELPLIV